MNQREMGFLANVKEPVMVETALLTHCKNRLDAIRLCVQLSNYSNEVVCENLGIDKGHFSRIMQGKAHFPDSKSVDLMMLCGNYAPMQYEVMRTGYILQKDTLALRKEMLRRELEDIEKAEQRVA
jgi:hypothetical protein